MQKFTMGNYRLHRPKYRAAFGIALVTTLVACADLPDRIVAPSIEASAAVAAGNSTLVLANNKFSSDFASRVTALGGTIVRLHDGAGIALVQGVDAAALQALPGVREAVADQVFTVSDQRAPNDLIVPAAGGVKGASQLNPATAVLYPWQWNMHLIGADAAWAAGKLGSAGVTAAILDSGIDYDNPDLNGLVDLSRSTSFVPSDDQITTTYFPSRHVISDYNGHGTNVAAQVSSKAFAFAGVTSKTTLIGVKVLGRTGSGSFSGIFAGVLWAADHGADVANMSLGVSFAKTGAGTFIGLINRVFAYAGQKGMLVLVAAGNDRENLDNDGNSYPAFCGTTHVICVSAVGPPLATSNPNTFAYYSNYGRSAIDVAAPGGNADAAHGFTVSEWPWGPDIASWVWSFCTKTLLAGLTPGGAPILTACAAGNRLSGYIGTSQAAPHVTGLAALLIAEYGRGKPSQIKQMVRDAVVDIGQPGVDPYFGKGRIDVRQALGL